MDDKDDSSAGFTHTHTQLEVETGVGRGSVHGIYFHGISIDPHFYDDT